MWLFLALVPVITINAQPIISNDTPAAIDVFYPSQEWSDPFDWKLLKSLTHKSENILVSPFSLKLILAILYEGSSGITQREFETVLKFPEKTVLRDKLKTTLNLLQADTKNSNDLKLNTALFLDNNLELTEKFSQKVEDYYNASVISMNFTDTNESCDRINYWVQEATSGSIERLTDPDDLRDTIMLLSNAIYFKGAWKYPFPLEQTAVEKFYVNTENAIYIPFMTVTESFYYYESHILEAQILRLPYENNEFSLFIMLPFAKGGLEHLINNINFRDLSRQLYYMDKKIVKVSIPKFKFKFKSSYSNILQEFGLKTMFGNTASFPGMVKGNSTILRRLVVSDILQTSGIDLDERGTVVYAATDVIIGNKIGIPDSIFNANHPFLFFIQEEKAKKVFFMGTINNPLHITMKIHPEKIENHVEHHMDHHVEHHMTI